MDIEFDSDLDELSEIEFDAEVRPYAYEPLRPQRELNSPESSRNSSDDFDSDSDENTEDGPTVDEWCSCSKCVQMPTAVESKCCKSTHIIDQWTEDLDCITDHEGFAVNCTNIHVLRTSFYEFILQNGRPGEEELIHEVYRYIAYRRFTRWIYGLLGKKHRRVIPACAVNKIREAFPSEQYAGFKYPQ